MVCLHLLLRERDGIPTSKCFIALCLEDDDGDDRVIKMID